MYGCEVLIVVRHVHGCEVCMVVLWEIHYD